MPADLRIAVLADVHGNAYALEAVLTQVRAAAPDLIVNLGDQVWGRTAPADVYALQRELDAVEVRGNNDEKLAWSRERLGPHGDAFRTWLSEQLPAGAAARLTELPLSASVADGAVFATHGTPLDANQELMWGWRPGGWMMRSATQLCQLLTGVEADVVLVGHTHREGLLSLDGRLLVNVGSVGWQIDRDPRARWTLLERRAGRWRIDFEQVLYDHAAAAHQTLQNDPTAVDEAAIYLSGDEPSGPES